MKTKPNQLFTVLILGIHISEQLKLVFPIWVPKITHPPALMFAKYSLWINKLRLRKCLSLQYKLNFYCSDKTCKYMYLHNLVISLLHVSFLETNKWKHPLSVLLSNITTAAEPGYHILSHASIMSSIQLFSRQYLCYYRDCSNITKLHGKTLNLNIWIFHPTPSDFHVHNNTDMVL